MTNEEPLILAVNSGSSSLKFGLFAQRDGDEAALYQGEADSIGKPGGKLTVTDASHNTILDEPRASATQTRALEAILAALAKCGTSPPVAVGHRVVHGGPHLREHQPITPKVIETLEASVHFAPLHIPPALTLIRETERLLPHAQQFACFDTAFHATMPETSARYPLPVDFYREGVQRYGFHGLSYESVLYRLGDKLPSRVICAHLGSGASLAAIRDGRSIDTSMGLTPTGGIPMATRTGDLDPGVLIFLMRNNHLDAAALETLLNKQSGLAALSGGESDMRRLQAAMESGDQQAALAVNIFAGGVRKFIGAYAAELGGLDLLIFTGGIGEHSQFVRSLVCQGLEFLGIRPGEEGPQAQSQPRVLAMPSEEEAQIARHARRLMLSSAAPSADITAD
ncbi:MAG: acetate/propionate family kinase [Acidobacteriaceae bacterium]